MAKKKKELEPIKPFSSIREMLMMAVNEDGEKIAYKFKNPDGTVREVTYIEFYQTVEALGASLTEMGLGSSHIAIVSENRYDWIVAYLTVLQSAGVFVPIDRQLTTKEKLHLLTDSESEAVFFSKQYLTWFVENKASMPNIKAFICFDIDKDTDGIISYKRLIAEGAKLDKTAYDSLKSNENELKMLVYTSGTTGIAKGVMLSEHNLVSGVYYGLQVSRIYDTALSILPYHHTYESVCDILVNIHSHATLCINSVMRELVSDMQLYHPTNIYIVPAIAEFIYFLIMKNLKEKGKLKTFKKGVKISKAALRLGIDIRPKLFAELHNLFGGKLRKIVCGGAPIRPEMGEFFNDIGIPMTGGYGITECSPLVSVNDESSNDFNTAGHRLACLQWRIDEPNVEGIGEIAVKGDVVMLGYYKMPDKTAEAIRDGWFFTGDYGYITPDDQICITGRKKNIIVLSNGKNIYPEEIENLIMNIDCISEVVVRGLKNSKGDEHALEAEVYLNEEKNESEVKALISEALAELPNYKKITKVVIRNEPFPKTTSNKIIRN
ncbi:MAG: AMP-binding protein [Eubacteriales bacterium]|nr:AMP-binding protein [Eubacterium sp.]MDY5493425.1 AMP-binding protein [Eubacteriales bacterium]